MDTALHMSLVVKESCRRVNQNSVTSFLKLCVRLNVEKKKRVVLLTHASALVYKYLYAMSSPPENLFTITYVYLITIYFYFYFQHVSYCIK